MDNRRTYKVNIQGIEHDLLLTELGAKRYGDRARLVEATGVADDTTDEDEDNSTEEESDEAPAAKARAPRNKSRSTRNK